MDYFAILSSHLDFIRRFYEVTAEPLEVRKAKIDRDEEPFMPTGSREDYNEPPYLQEWQEADDFLRVLGQCALGLLEKALHDYLRHFAENEGWEREKEKLDKGNWFKKYCDNLEGRTAFTWANSPVTFSQLEQINLSRNDFAHDPMLGQIRSRQDPNHFKRYPTPVFAEEFEVAYFTTIGEANDEPWSLNVAKEVLLPHIEYVRQFCAFVDRNRTKF
jgi:hypothetical protein